MDDLTAPKELILSSAQIRDHVNRIQSVMQAVMQEGTHYGVIPGTSKKTLYKAGSEVLLTTFRIAVDPEIEDLSTEDEIRYRIRARGRHQTTDIIVGTGVGECSSNEEKYKWVSAICDAQFDETEEERRRIKYKRDYNDVVKVKQVRAEPADIANTILKMAKKRAQIDLCLTATAASDIFTQDIEELPVDVREAVSEQRQVKTVSQPQSLSGTNKNEKISSDKQRKMVFARLKAANITTPTFEAAFGKLDDLPFNSVNPALEWILKSQTSERPAYQ